MKHSAVLMGTTTDSRAIVDSSTTRVFFDDHLPITSSFNIDVTFTRRFRHEDCPKQLSRKGEEFLITCFQCVPNQKNLQKRAFPFISTVDDDHARVASTWMIYPVDPTSSVLFFGLEARPSKITEVHLSKTLRRMIEIHCD